MSSCSKCTGQSARDETGVSRIKQPANCKLYHFNNFELHSVRAKRCSFSCSVQGIATTMVCCEYDDRTAVSPGSSCLPQIISAVILANSFHLSAPSPVLCKPCADSPSPFWPFQSVSARTHAWHPFLLSLVCRCLCRKTADLALSSSPQGERPSNTHPWHLPSPSESPQSPQPPAPVQGRI